MNAMKAALNHAFAGMGFELTRKPPGSTHGIELSGLTFREFLNCYLGTRDLSNFFFIQVGAFDGKANDPIHELAVKWGLKGLIVEPQPAAFQALKKNYQGNEQLILENVAISTEDGDGLLYTIRRDIDFLQHVNQAASFNPDHTRRLLRQHITKQASAATRSAFRRLNLGFEECIEAQPVKTCTFRSLLAKHGVIRYDFLQVDTEGFDYEVLKMADIETNVPTLINYEHEHLKPADQQSSWEYLRKLNYRIFTHEGDTSAFLLPTAANRPCLPQLAWRLPRTASESWNR
jgi:FkbM family methyltransferase